MTRTVVIERTIASAAHRAGRPLPVWLAVHLAEAVSAIPEETTAVETVQIPDGIHLTPRMRQIAVLLADGLSAEQIAKRLFLSVNTVKTQLRFMYAALGARNGAHAAALITSFGLGSPKPGPVREVRRK